MKKQCQAGTRPFFMKITFLYILGREEYERPLMMEKTPLFATSWVFSQTQKEVIPSIHKEVSWSNDVFNKVYFT